MSKNIKVNFVFPQDKENALDNIRRFYNDLILTYINNLNCSHVDKKRIVEELATLSKDSASGE